MSSLGIVAVEAGGNPVARHDCPPNQTRAALSSGNAGTAKSNIVAEEMMPSHIVCSTLRVKFF